MEFKDKGPLRVLRRCEVEAITGLSRSSIYSKLKENDKRPNDYDPDFPRPVRLGLRAVGWLESDIQQWLRARVLQSHPGGDK